MTHDNCTLTPRPSSSSERVVGIDTWHAHDDGTSWVRYAGHWAQVMTPDDPDRVVSPTTSTVESPNYRKGN